MNQIERKDIESLVIKGAGQKFVGSDFRQLRKPGVYVFMLGGLPLYVGQGKMLLRRIGSNHHQALKAIELADEVLLYPCISESAAIELEIILIGKLKPKFNVNRGMYMKKLLGIQHLYA